MSKVFKAVAKIAVPVMAIASGVSALGAATTAAASLSAGAMVVGGGLSLAGAATGNKSLSKIGGLLTLGGGIGSMFTGGLTNPLDAFKSSGKSFSSGMDLGGGYDGLLSANPTSAGVSAASNAGSFADSFTQGKAAIGNDILNVGKAAPIVESGGAAGGIMDKLKAYDITGGDILQGLGKAGEAMAKNKADSAQVDAYNRRSQLDEQKYATQQTNLAAPTTIGIGTVPNTPGLLYQGMDRDPVTGQRKRYA